MTKLAVLASGSGTNLKAMIMRDVPVALVLADKPCMALETAQIAGIPTELIDRRHFGYSPGIGEGWERRGFTWAVTEELLRYKIDLVAMAGFFTILHEDIFRHFEGDILNIHPSLLPDFKGEFAVREALAAGVSETGSTIHIATPVVDDHRYIVRQVRVQVHPGDDVDALWERIKGEERKMYPQVLRDIISGAINLNEIRRRA